MRSELADALKANVALQKANTALQTELDSLKAAQCGAPEPWRERVVLRLSSRSPAAGEGVMVGLRRERVRALGLVWGLKGKSGRGEVSCMVLYMMVPD